MHVLRVSKYVIFRDNVRKGPHRKVTPANALVSDARDRNDVAGGSRLLALQLNQRALSKVVVIQFGLHNVVY